MTDIIDKLNETMLGLFPNDGIKFEGLCDLVIKGDQVHPVTIDERRQVSINDRWGVLVFHRLLNGSLDPSDEQSFGRRTGKKFNQTVRTVIAAKAKKGEGFIFDFAQNIPETLILADTHEFINIESVNLIMDQLAVHNAEFGETNYEKHVQTWNIAALEYEIEFLKC